MTRRCIIWDDKGATTIDVPGDTYPPIIVFDGQFFVWGQPSPGIPGTYEKATPVFVLPEDELCIAPGADDLTFGSVLYGMLRHCFNRYERAPGLGPRDFTSCKFCSGSDAARATGARPSLERVKHTQDCLLAKHLPRLRAMANKGAT